MLEHVASMGYLRWSSWQPTWWQTGPPLRCCLPSSSSWLQCTQGGENEPAILLKIIIFVFQPSTIFGPLSTSSPDHRSRNVDAGLENQWQIRRFKSQWQTRSTRSFKNERFHTDIITVRYYPRWWSRCRYSLTVCVEQDQLKHNCWQRFCHRFQYHQ